MSDEPASGLQGADFAFAMFSTMLLATGAVLDIMRSATLGAASIAVTACGLLLMFRVLKSPQPRLRRLLLAALAVVAVLLVRFALSKVLIS